MIKILDFEKAKDYVLERLGNELSPHLTYHCLEHTKDAWWTKIVVKARASINQDKPLIGADQEAKGACAPSAREAGTASEAVEKVDDHG